MAKLEKLFICIGAQKAGTTWLDAVLQEDNRIARCPYVKEVHYFDYIHVGANNLVRWRSRHCKNFFKKHSDIAKPMLSAWMTGGSESLAKYCRKQNIPDAQARQLHLMLSKLNDEWYSDLLKFSEGQLCSMDITPAYATVGVEGFKHMARIANQTFFLFILRNPVERAWSGLMESKKNAKIGIDGYINKYGQDIDLLFQQCTQFDDVKKRNNYLQTLQDIDQAGIKDNLMIRFYDDTKADPGQLINDIYKFIELPAPSMAIFDSVLNTKVYSTQKSPMPPALELRLKDYFKPMVQTLHKEYFVIPRSWQDYFEI